MKSSNNILYTRRLKTETRGVVGWTDLLERRARRLAYKRWWNSQHAGHWKAWPSSKDNVKRRKWKKENPEMVRESTRKHHRKMVANVSTNWLRSHWKNKWKLTNVPDSLLECHGALIKLQREIKLWQNQKTSTNYAINCLTPTTA